MYAVSLSNTLTKILSLVFRIELWLTGSIVFVKQCWKVNGLQQEGTMTAIRWHLSTQPSFWIVRVQLQITVSPVHQHPLLQVLKKNMISHHRCQRWRSMYEKRSLQWKSMTYVYFYCPRTWLRLRCAACFTCKWLPALILTSFTHLFVGIWVCFFWGFWVFFIVGFSFHKTLEGNHHYFALWVEILLLHCFFRQPVLRISLKTGFNKQYFCLAFLNISVYPIQQTVFFHGLLENYRHVFKLECRLEASNIFLIYILWPIGSM